VTADGLLLLDGELVGRGPGDRRVFARAALNRHRPVLVERDFERLALGCGLVDVQPAVVLLADRPRVGFPPSVQVRFFFVPLGSPVAVSGPGVAVAVCPPTVTVTGYLPISSLTYGNCGRPTMLLSYGGAEPRLSPGTTSFSRSWIGMVGVGTSGGFSWPGCQNSHQ
jgi:hypothetical protein